MYNTKAKVKEYTYWGKANYDAAIDHFIKYCYNTDNFMSGWSNTSMIGVQSLYQSGGIVYKRNQAVKLLNNSFNLLYTRIYEQFKGVMY